MKESTRDVLGMALKAACVELWRVLYAQEHTSKAARRAEIVPLIDALARELQEAAPGKLDAWYIEQARDMYQSEGEIEIDEGATISYGGDPGAYVQAWVWVDREEEE